LLVECTVLLFLVSNGDERSSSWNRKTGSVALSSSQILQEKFANVCTYNEEDVLPAFLHITSVDTTATVGDRKLKLEDS
jgi:hypothetical protein